MDHCSSILYKSIPSMSSYITDGSLDLTCLWDGRKLLGVMIGRFPFFLDDLGIFPGLT